MSEPDIPRDDERQPLLAQHDGENHEQPQAKSQPRGCMQGCCSQLRSLKDRVIPKFDVISPKYRWVPLLGCIIIMFNEAEYMVKQVAYVRAIEAMYCVEYYQIHDPAIAKLGKNIPEQYCKIDTIEKMVAQTSAWSLFARMTCAMIGNIPLGYIADKKGRRIVLILHKINVSVSGALQILVYLLYPKVPIWTLYLTGIPGLVGGNFDLGLAMLFASYTDVMPSVMQRTTLFFLTTSMQYPPQAVGPLLGGVLMNLKGPGQTPEYAMIAGWACGFTALLLTAFFFPETLQRKSPVAKDPASDSTKQDAEPIGWFYRINNTLYKKLKHTWKDAQGALKGLGIANVLLLAVSLLTTNTGIKSIDWFGLVQYPVVKFNWNFSQTTILVSIQAVIIIINYAFLLPSYNKLGILRLGYSAPTTSFAIMVLSVLLLISGSLILGFAGTVAVFLVGLLIYTLGGGLPVATQAYISVLLDKRSLARVLASLSVAAVGGKVLASALFPKVLAAGLDDGREVMKGLPLFVAACLFTVSGIAFSIVALRLRLERPLPEEEQPEADVTTQNVENS